MASIERRGEAWRVRWRTLHGQTRSRKCPTRGAAAQLQREIETELALGRDWQPEEPPRRHPALADLAEQFLRHHVAELDPRTLNVRTYQLDVWLRWAESVGAVDASSLTRGHLVAYLAWLQEPTGRHGRPRSRSTALRYTRAVELLWTWADDWQGEVASWSGLVPRAREVAKGMRRPAERYRSAPSWEEMGLAVLACPEGWIRDLAYGLYLTGLRVQQVLSLRRDDVDLERGLLTVRAELGKTRQEQTGRVVPVSPLLVAWVRELELQPDGWLIACGRARRVARPRDLSRAWERAEVRAEVWEGRPHHAFRAGWLTGLRRLGAELDVLEVLLGHAPTPTARAYLDPEQALPLRSAVQLVPPIPGLPGRCP